MLNIIYIKLFLQKIQGGSIAEFLLYNFFKLAQFPEFYYPSKLQGGVKFYELFLQAKLLLMLHRLREFRKLV